MIAERKIVEMFRTVFLEEVSPLLHVKWKTIRICKDACAQCCEDSGHHGPMPQTRGTGLTRLGHQVPNHNLATVSIEKS